MIKKQIEIKHNNTLTALKRKMYKEYGMLWHFTLEEMVRVTLVIIDFTPLLLYLLLLVFSNLYITNI